MNGRSYYYAVVAYDRGDPSKDIYPSENTRFLSKDALGRVSTDINTVVVTPAAPVAGYVPPESGINASRVSGLSTPAPYFEVIDPIKVIEGNYTISFNDSLRKSGNEKAAVNISSAYSVTDPSGNLIVANSKLTPQNGVVFNGLRLSVDSSYQRLDSIKMKQPGIPARGSLANDSTGWSVYRGKNLRFGADQVKVGNVWGVRYPRDYVMVFSNTYSDSSNKLTNLFGSGAPPAKLVNFRMYDITNKKRPVRIQFGFVENSPYRRDTLSFQDLMILSDSSGNDYSWRITFSGDSSSTVPLGTDSLFFRFTKPFSSNDQFAFTATKPAYDMVSAVEQLNRVKAVPNPYIVTNVFEEPLPTTVRGRGERIIYFINLPPNARVHIYTSAGNLVKSLEHDGNLNDGSVEWDLRTKEGLDVAYGVYFYVVELEGLSDKKMGKLAIIK